MNYIVGFDLDDTIYKRETALYNTFKQLNIDYDFNQFKHLFEKHSDYAIALFHKKEISLDESRILRITNLMQEIKQPKPLSFALKFQELYQSNQNNIDIDPNFIKIFNYLKSKNVKLFVLTNGPSNHQKLKMINLGLSAYIDPQDCFISDDIKCYKPNKDAFEYVEKTLNLKGYQYIFIGDHLENDIKGALNANWHAIYYNWKKADSYKDVVSFKTSQEIYEYLKTIIK